MRLVDPTHPLSIHTPGFASAGSDTGFAEEGLSCTHHIPFPHGITHVESLGGDISDIASRRLTIAAFLDD